MRRAGETTNLGLRPRTTIGEEWHWARWTRVQSSSSPSKSRRREYVFSIPALAIVLSLFCGEREELGSDRVEDWTRTHRSRKPEHDPVKVGDLGDRISAGFGLGLGVFDLEWVAANGQLDGLRAARRSGSLR